MFCMQDRSVNPLHGYNDYTHLKHILIPGFGIPNKHF
jgi:hypothetical protein